MQRHRYRTIRYTESKWLIWWQNAELTFHVVRSDGPILVGLAACEALQLVSLHQQVHTVESEDPAPLQTHEVITDKEQLISLFPKQFTGIGSLPGKAHLDVDPAITPVIHKQRICPIHVKDDLKRELDAMEKLDVIAPVEKATDWVSRLTVARNPAANSVSAWIQLISTRRLGGLSIASSPLKR